MKFLRSNRLIKSTWNNKFVKFQTFFVLAFAIIFKKEITPECELILNSNISSV